MHCVLLKRSFTEGFTLLLNSYSIWLCFKYVELKIRIEIPNTKICVNIEATSQQIVNQKWAYSIGRPSSPTKPANLSPNSSPSKPLPSLSSFAPAPHRRTPPPHPGGLRPGISRHARRQRSHPLLAWWGDLVPFSVLWCQVVGFDITFICTANPFLLPIW